MISVIIRGIIGDFPKKIFLPKYRITEEEQENIIQTNELFYSLDGNILLLTDQPYDHMTELFDTYIDRENVYFTNMEYMENSGFSNGRILLMEESG